MSLKFVVACAVLMAANGAHAATTRGAFDKAPFYDGKGATARPIAHIAITWRTEPGSLDPTPQKSPALSALLDSLQVELGTLDLTRGVGSPPDRAPDVRFGVRRGGTGDDGMPRAPSEIDTREPRRMTFEIEGPSKKWRDGFFAAAGDSIAGVITIQLGFDQYWVRQASWKGNKTIELGTGRSMPIAWLTSLDDPVQVLQLTGALVTRDGKIVRVGAEGVIARRTGMKASVAGVQEILTEWDLATLSAPENGTPPWRAALRSLVEGLLTSR